MINKIKKELIELNIINENSITPYFHKVRDRDDVGVERCEKSGVIFLNRVDHIEESYYNAKPGTAYWNAKGRNEALKETKTDDLRRFEQFSDLVTGKKYADIGCGLGGVLELMKDFAGEANGVELQMEIRELLNNLGFKVFAGIDDLETDYDLISMFHVFEHILSPLDFLKKTATKLKTGGKIIIEVPHANDALLKSYQSEKFKEFTLWSEHIILHTKKSLTVYLENAGFKNIHVQGFQRFPISNHLYWLSKGLPNGQNILSEFNNPELVKAYQKTLNLLDETDTIIAVAEKV
jgi:2-polyprenyl-3-methyl-5-hydroxy-6-metoxy-1,4-benzoquinol methylase